MFRIQFLRDLGEDLQLVPDGLEILGPLEEPQPGPSCHIALDVPGHPVLDGIVQLPQEQSRQQRPYQQPAPPPSFHMLQHLSPSLLLLYS